MIEHHFAHQLVDLLQHYFGHPLLHLLRPYFARYLQQCVARHLLRSGEEATAAVVASFVELHCSAALQRGQGGDGSCHRLLWGAAPAAGRRRRRQLSSPSSLCCAVVQLHKIKLCLWSCVAALRILCSGAPQTNKENKQEKKK